jgi:hypothetical protein
MPRDEDLIGDLASSSSVDWDAEWKKVVQEQKKGKKAAGDGYRSEAEIKAIKAANQVRKQAIQAQASIPSWQMLKGDWKVRFMCVCVCARHLGIEIICHFVTTRRP